MYIPTLDPRNAATVDPSRDTGLKFPHLPGLDITVPAGTTLRDIDGRPTTTINVTEDRIGDVASYVVSEG